MESALLHDEAVIHEYKLIGSIEGTLCVLIGSSFGALATNDLIYLLRQPYSQL